MTYVPCNNPVMLAKHLHKVPEKKRVFPALASEKYDGVYAYGMPDGRIFSRAGNECFSLRHVSDHLRAVSIMADREGLMPHVLIFEVYRQGWSVKDISGAFRRQSEQFSSAQILIHDAIPAADFVEGICSIPFQYRKDIAEYYARTMQYPVVKQTLVYSEDGAIALAKDIIARGGEGIILRNPHGIWVAGKRNEDLVKIKQEETLDLRVVDVREGKGKYAGTTGTLVVTFNGGTQQISGMTDAERLAWWAHPELIMDQIVEVQFMCLTPDGWMREPRFKCVRYDKEQADNE